MVNSKGLQTSPFKKKKKRLETNPPPRRVAHRRWQWLPSPGVFVNVKTLEKHRKHLQKREGVRKLPVNLKIIHVCPLRPILPPKKRRWHQLAPPPPTYALPTSALRGRRATELLEESGGFGASLRVRPKLSSAASGLRWSLERWCKPGRFPFLERWFGGFLKGGKGLFGKRGIRVFA